MSSFNSKVSRQRSGLFNREAAAHELPKNTVQCVAASRLRVFVTRGPWANAHG